MNLVKLTCQNVLKNVSIVRNINLSQSRFIQTSSNPLLSQDKVVKKRPGSEIIRVYDQNGKVVGNKTKQEAETIAKKNGYVLVPMEVIGKPKFPEYQLKYRHEEAFSIDFAESTDASEEKIEENESKKTTKSKKEIKRITFETSIAPNDLKVKIDQINRWITKDREVHIIITGSRDVALDTFFQRISDMFSKESRFLHNKQKGNNLRLIVDKRPTKGDSSTGSIDETEAGESNKSESSKKKVGDFKISDDLLSNDAELEKFLDKIKKSK